MIGCFLRRKLKIIPSFFIFILVFSLICLTFLTPLLAQTYTFITKWGSFGTGDSQFDSPQGVGVDSANNIYVADRHNDRIQKFTSSGTFTTKWGSSGTEDGQFDEPQGVGVDSADNIYIADTENDRIQKFTSSGTFTTKWGSSGTGDGQFDEPQGVGIDSADNIYVADQHNDRIQKFDSSGTFITKWGSKGAADGKFRHPRRVDVDSSNNVYVADKNNNRIQKFTSSGTFITKWGSKGTGDGEFDKPQGIGLDSSNNVYVADTENDRIQKFGEAAAPVTTLTSTPASPDGNNSWFKTNPTITLTPDKTATTYYDWSITPPTTVYASPFNMPAEGTYILYYRSDDGVKVEPVKNQTFKYDGTAPTNPSAFSSPTHTPGVLSTINIVKINWPAVNQSGGASDSISGVDGYSVLWSENTPQTPNTTKDLEETATSVTSSPLSASTWYFNLRTEDNAGNWSTSTSYGPFLIGRGILSGSIAINNGAFYTKSRSVVLNLSASSNITEMRFANDSNCNWSAWENYSTTKSWTLSSGNGTKTVWAQFRDSSGNISSDYSDSIILDTSKPKTFAVKSSAWRASTKRAAYYLNLYRQQKNYARKTHNRARRKVYLSLAKIYYRRWRYCKKQIANAPLFWKVTDNTTQVTVKLKIKKRVYSKARATKKADYFKLYKKTKSKKVTNPIMNIYYKNQAQTYFHRYHSIKSIYYRHVKTVSYGLTTVNLLRRYIWRTSSPGIYKFYVLAIDRAKNAQTNVAKNFLVVR